MELDEVGGGKEDRVENTMRVVRRVKKKKRDRGARSGRLASEITLSCT